MLNLLQGANDDQVALMGCLLAVISSAGLMYLSFFIGPAAKKQHEEIEAKSTIKQLPIRSAGDGSHERAA